MICVTDGIDREEGIVVSGGNDCTVRVWDSSLGTCIRVLEGHTDWVTCVLHVGGTGIVSGSSSDMDGCIRIWDFKKGTESCSRIIKEKASWLRTMIHLKLLTDQGLL